MRRITVAIEGVAGVVFSRIVLIIGIVDAGPVGVVADQRNIIGMGIGYLIKDLISCGAGWSAGVGEHLPDNESLRGVAAADRNKADHQKQQ